MGARRGAPSFLFSEVFSFETIAQKRKKLACNRPYGNERPSEKLRNYPCIPNKKDIKDVRMSLRDYS